MTNKIERRHHMSNNYPPRFGGFKMESETTTINVDTNVKIPSESEIKAMIPNNTTSSKTTLEGTAGFDDVEISSSTDEDAINIPTDNSMQEMVTKVIKESSDLVTALEAVGAMYGIPSENIIVDNSMKSIRVVGDNIIAPEIKNTIGNTKAIVCSIGSVLDYISQRIDDKLTNYQNERIITNKKESVRREANPAKGKVVGRYEDRNGDEIIVYDTGMIDSANTNEAHEKIDELRQDLKIPMYNPSALKVPPSYFSEDEDDIMSDIDPNTTDTDIDKVDLSVNIQESHLYMDLVSKFNNTRHLGYDLLTAQGFDFVKPTQIVMESASGKKKSTKVINPEDIKYMKFDNSNILKAIEYFNKARAEQPHARKGKFKIDQFVNSPNYQKAIDCLNKQFNARINIRFVKTDESGNSLYTTIYRDIKNNLSISKSKGFQLNGLPIDIMVINKAIDEEADPDDMSLFGQFVMSGLLHEIFHNIAAAIRSSSNEFLVGLSTTIAVASSLQTAKSRRIVISRYVDSINDIAGKKINRLARRKLVKELTVLTTIQHDESALSMFKDALNTGTDTEQEIDKLLEQYRHIVDVHKKRYKKPSKISKVLSVVVAGIGCVMTTLGVLVSSTLGLASPIGVFIGMIMIGTGVSTACAKLSSNYYNDMMKQYKSSKHMEEYYCDLFAGMYSLPLTFLIGSPGHRKFTPNQVDTEKLNELSKLEKQIFEYIFSKYPTTNERNYAALKIAKNMLSSGQDLDPSIEKYLQWIVDNYSSMADTDIEVDYNETTFDPKSADDLDQHLQSIINQGSIVLTEYDLSWIFDNIN